MKKPYAAMTREELISQIRSMMRTRRESAGYLRIQLKEAWDKAEAWKKRSEQYRELADAWLRLYEDNKLHGLKTISEQAEKRKLNVEGNVIHLPSNPRI